MPLHRFSFLFVDAVSITCSACLNCAGQVFSLPTAATPKTKAKVSDLPVFPCLTLAQFSLCALHSQKSLLDAATYTIKQSATAYALYKRYNPFLIKRNCDISVICPANSLCAPLQSAQNTSWFWAEQVFKNSLPSFTCWSRSADVLRKLLSS